MNSKDRTRKSKNVFFELHIQSNTTLTLHWSRYRKESSTNFRIICWYFLYQSYKFTTYTEYFNKQHAYLANNF